MMRKVKCSDIIKAVDGSILCGSEEAEIFNISIDSRKIEVGDLFIPIAGEKFDGHNFLISALQNGASAALTHKDMPSVEGKTLIKVADTQKALKDTASWYRQLFDIPLIAITGSVGKTSTKDMVAEVMAQKYHVHKTQGNFNNEIGLPLTLFHLEASHQVAVLEMGMSNLGEISRLTQIARPDVAIITNIGMSHIENLGSQENILKAKLEILEGLSEEGLVIINADDPLLFEAGKQMRFRTVFYGIRNDAEYKAYDIKSDGENGTIFKVKIGEIEYNVHIPVPGIHNVYNALAALAAGIELKIPMKDIIQGISRFSPGKMRLNIISNHSIKIINDAYNASPQSMEAAIKVLMDISTGGRTVAILADMLEMGKWAPDAHRGVGAFAASKGVHSLLAVGTNGKFIAEGALEAGMPKDAVYAFTSNEQAIEFLDQWIQPGDIILVKGSRGMKMEEIVEHLYKSH